MRTIIGQSWVVSKGHVGMAVGMVIKGTAHKGQKEVRVRSQRVELVRWGGHGILLDLGP